jgi:hypothetical protein
MPNVYGYPRHLFFSPIFNSFSGLLQSSYGFVDYFDHRSAAAALLTLNGSQM